MKRHLNTYWTLSINFAMLAWLVVACAPRMQSTEVVTPATQTMGATAEAPGVVAPAPEIVGRWRAAIEMPDGSGELELILDIRQSASGGLSAFLDVPIMGVTGTPVTFSYDDGTIKWSVPEYGTYFNGSLIDDSTIEGSVTNPEGGPPGTITFERAE